MENKKHETQPEEVSLLKKLISLAGYITECLASILSTNQIDFWYGNKKELKKKLREVFSIHDEYAVIRTEWEEFYKDQFNWTVDFLSVIIPPKPAEEGWRLLFIAKGMTMNLAFAIAIRLFKAWRYNDDLDKVILKNARTTNENYAVWVRDGVEPDAECLGKSARQADPDMKIGITVLERIMLEIKYFLETGNHLDYKGITFCSGSRVKDGRVPSCGWVPRSGGFEVGWCPLGISDSDCGVCVAVS